MEWAKIAWRYFENNTVNETGMVNSVDKYPASTMWDTSSYLMGLIAAYRLEIVTESEFDRRISQVLTSLEGMPLFEGKLPNKSYNTQSLAMVNYQNQETAEGIGWSALDIGRVLVPMNILVWNYPIHTERVRALLSSWDFSEFVIDGTLYGAALEEGDTEWDLVQEGRLGYEEYAAKSLSLMGLDVSEAMRYDDDMKIVNILGVKVVTENRSPDKFTALNYVVSELYILDGIEYGWDQHSAELAYRVFDAQRRRYEETNILTAVSEDNIDQAPYFIYNTVFSDGKYGTPPRRMASLCLS